MVPRPSIANRHSIRRLHMCSNRKFSMSEQFEANGTFLHTIPYDGGDSTSIPPALPHKNAYSTTATVPRPSIANRHSIRRLHMCANRKFSMSEQFEQAEPSYTPYHMMAESRPLYLLIRLLKTPLRLQRRYHADPLLIGTSFVVYICVPIVNSA